MSEKEKQLNTDVNLILFYWISPISKLVCFHQAFPLYATKIRFYCTVLILIHLSEGSWEDSFWCFSFITKAAFLYNRNISGKHLLPLKACFLSGNEIGTQKPLIQKFKDHLIYAGVYLHKAHIHRFKTLNKHSVLICSMELPASFLFIHDTWGWGISISAASVIVNPDCCFLPYLLVIFLLSSIVNSPSITIALMIARATAAGPHCQLDILHVEWYVRVHLPTAAGISGSSVMRDHAIVGSMQMKNVLSPGFTILFFFYYYYCLFSFVLLFVLISLLCSCCCFWENLLLRNERIKLDFIYSC